MRENAKVNEVFRQRAEAVRSGAELLYEKTRDWQLIKKFMCNRSEDFALNAVQQLKLERYNFIYNQLVCGRYSDREVVNTVVTLYGISQVQAYEDMSCSRELFNAVLNINKRFELNNELQIAKDARRKCMELQDFKSAAAFGKLIKEILVSIEDEELSPGEDFEGHEIEAVFDPSLLGAPAVNMKEVLAAINAKRKVPIKIDMFEHLKYEEVAK